MVGGSWDATSDARDLPAGRVRQLSLHVVGAGHPNKRGGDRRFEILLCVPGEPVDLVPEPRNPADPNAVAVFSVRGVQIGYVTAERAPLVGGMLRAGREVRAVFQAATATAAVIRLGLDGTAPTLPTPKARPTSGHEDVDFWPDDVPPDD